MRGPVVFLASLAAVTIAALSLFLPLHRERADLSALVIEGAAITSSGHSGTPPPQVGRLASALGDGLGDQEAVFAVRAAALEFSPIDLIVIDGLVVEFPAVWKNVPRILARLARREGLVIRSFSAEPTEVAEACRIRVEIEPRGNGIEAR
ncbi:MAG: hypothetical protein ABFS86_00980 [Planctomycetota bacterium]